jgi:hypothetical protein
MHNIANRLLPPLCFHTLTSCFSCKTFISSMICVAPCVFPLLGVIRARLRRPAPNSVCCVLRFSRFSFVPCFQQFADSFSLLHSFSDTRAFIFSELQTLLQKHPGYGYPRRSGRHAGMGSAWTRTQWWPRCQRPRAHTESRAERRRNVAKRIATTGAAPLFTKRAGGIGTQPMASRFALRIDALHGEAGQKLHIASPQRPLDPRGSGRQRNRPSQTDKCWRGFWRRSLLLSRGNTTIYWGALPGRWHFRCLHAPETQKTMTRDR